MSDKIIRIFSFNSPRNSDFRNIGKISTSFHSLNKPQAHRFGPTTITSVQSNSISSILLISILFIIMEIVGFIDCISYFIFCKRSQCFFFPFGIIRYSRSLKLSSSKVHEYAGLRKATSIKGHIQIDTTSKCFWIITLESYIWNITSRSHFHTTCFRGNIIFLLCFFPVSSL